MEKLLQAFGCEYRNWVRLRSESHLKYTCCGIISLNLLCMSHAFALDLKVARRKSGLTQQDCAHLLDVQKSRISLLEQGKALPSVLEICTLSLLYGRSFESLFGSMLEEAHGALKERLATLPVPSNRWLGRFIRQNTLNRLAARLDDNKPSEHGPA
ncbi:helix-turn-helix transcriptional regulator [Hoeflea poritis]|uniref:Helix-turn-helix domain-containing protein n=1 Tax=Hoeflea poritis TaxID=2993659 RepID=A0ABT4VKP4_9HYPH|nr:helix-turn-helix domain-containing protein [Hoeflea poritis]MDA4845246.1 helix-turn-helix domain-containing protein [Hoeflea poritis]